LERHRRHGGVTEVRILGKGSFKGTASGYFDHEHLDALIAAIAPLANGVRPRLPYGDYPRISEANIYVSLHPVNRALLARSANRIQRAEATTSDADIVAYDLVGIDFDPVRPAGISSSDEEKAAALEVCHAVRAYLDDLGIRTILADSGNGYHLLVPITPYADVGAVAAAIHRLLQHLSNRFSTERVSVDTTVSNPSRIWKLYGTQSVKGDATSDRPHRWATIDLSSIPDDVDLLKIVEPILAASNGKDAAVVVPPTRLADVLPVARRFDVALGSSRPTSFASTDRRTGSD